MEQGVSTARDAVVLNMSGIYVRLLELMSDDSTWIGVCIGMCMEHQ
jgi:hypothetical protein